MASVTARGGRRETSKSQQVDKSKRRRQPRGSSRKSQASSLQATSLDAAALADIVEELRVIDHALSCAGPLAEEARVVVNASECDEPARRDPIAKISLRLLGVDVDCMGSRNLRLFNDPLIESIVAAADAVVEAARWRLDRVRCVLARCAEMSTPGSR